MIDQADKLRKIMQSRDMENESKPISPKKANVIAVSSGKGGVGKTNFAINFSISLKRLGMKLLLLMLT